MKHLALFALAGPALLAQTAAAPSLIAKADELQKASAAEVTQMINGMRFDEAVAKAASTAQTPFFPYPVVTLDALQANPAAANEHGAKAQEVLAANATLLNTSIAYANALRAAGQWEKATEALRAAAGNAEKNLEGFRASVAPISQFWEKLDGEAKTYVGTNEGRIKGDETALMAEKARLEKTWEEYKSKKIKLGKKELEQLDADTKAFEPKAKTYDAEAQKLAYHKGNLGRLDTIRGALKNMEKAGEVAGALRKNADTVQADVDRQKKEIQEFNAKQAEKKKPKKGAAPCVEGNKTWVNAVLADKNNLASASTPNQKAAFVNRLLVLDPGNETASKVLTNLKAGRDPYFAEPKGKGGKKAKK